MLRTVKFQFQETSHKHRQNTKATMVRARGMSRAFPRSPWGRAEHQPPPVGRHQARYFTLTQTPGARTLTIPLSEDETERAGDLPRTVGQIPWSL